ncbi:peptide-methionine (S)-S-oxide reductase [Pedobacter paludis]|uniref:peptide-methionine (S)-S-oxide reductase n=1 Tax=Pedobacter paludis TaxID=2203212 RepID=A0A317EZM7_9SPHI|nr:peptide-methionine (S)-S-oxide reductase [Pedobacter paludis]PWS31423.1 peptide methionine sulfoxide reductase [Pedobacter paludis]
MDKIGFGGSCHWCTEAIFQSLNGVTEVMQGWISSEGKDSTFSEAVIVLFEPSRIPLEILIAIHLHTHSCTSNHSMRQKYRSAVYTFDKNQSHLAENEILNLKDDFDKPIITRVLSFKDFKLNTENYLNYYYKNPEKAFCKNFVTPKLRILLDRFADTVNFKKFRHD